MVSSLTQIYMYMHFLQVESRLVKSKTHMCSITYLLYSYHYYVLMRLFTMLSLKLLKTILFSLNSDLSVRTKNVSTLRKH